MPDIAEAVSFLAEAGDSTIIQILPDTRKANAIAFLDRALGWFGRHGVAIQDVMANNGPAATSGPTQLQQALPG